MTWLPSGAQAGGRQAGNSQLHGTKALATTSRPGALLGRGRGHHPVDLTQELQVYFRHAHMRSNRSSQASFRVSSSVSTHTRRKAEAFGFKCSLQHSPSKNGSQREEPRKTPSKTQEAWQASARSWPSCTQSKDLGWRGKTHVLLSRLPSGCNQSPALGPPLAKGDQSYVTGSPPWHSRSVRAAKQ